MEFGLNEIHTAEIVNFLRFSRYQRAHRLKGIECAFQDLIESRLAEDNTFTDAVILIVRNYYLRLLSHYTCMEGLTPLQMRR